MSLSSLLLYASLFISLFFEVFLLITYFEIREELKFEKKTKTISLAIYPSVTIIIPCYNEERTVSKTIQSLLSLDYPEDKLSLIVVDDGSTDHTQEALNEFRNNPRIHIFKKENGGKHTALNFALRHVTSDLVGCLDADSFVAPDALRKIVAYFQDKKIMAVTPAVRVFEPKTVLQHVQRVEYAWGILFRRLLSSIDGLYVTPGPFSIFRTDVFKRIGGYRLAHHTEDMEIALRLQKHGYKIANSSSAYVYTVGPEKFSGLYKQRVRWTYGFLNNVIDYREMFFNKKYGNIGMFVLPIATISIFSTLYAAGEFLWGMWGNISEAMVKYQAVGWSWHVPHIALNWFAINTGIGTILSLFTVLLSLTILMLALYTVEGKVRFTKGIFYYLSLYIFIVPLWLAKATYSTITKKRVDWR